MSAKFQLLPSDQKRMIQLAFDQVDDDRNGFISPEELKKILPGLGLEASDKNVEQLMTELDMDKSGQISWEEFAEAMASWFSKK